jgi:hypothetical protein
MEAGARLCTILSMSILMDLALAADSIEAWSQCIRRCCENRAVVDRLRDAIRPPRRMDAVADEMLALYKNDAGKEVHASAVLKRRNSSKEPMR